MSSATDRLRELLDERGVKYEDDENVTRFFGPDGFEVVMQEDIDGKLDCLTPLYFTPEQAIAATLGAGTLTAEQVSNATYAHSIHADCTDADWQAIADELNTTLGSGTCKWKPADFITEGDWWNTECGESFTWEPYGVPKYCPNCGRRVEVDE